MKQASKFAFIQTFKHFITENYFQNQNFKFCITKESELLRDFFQIYHPVTPNSNSHISHKTCGKWINLLYTKTIHKQETMHKVD